MRHPASVTASQAVTATGPLVRRLLITAPDTIELIEERLPPLGLHDIHAQTIISGISHGTEMAWLTGTAAALRRQWDASQRIYRDGPGRDYPSRRDTSPSAGSSRQDPPSPQCDPVT